MQMTADWQPAASLDVIKARARMLKTIRAFFDARGVLEVETSLLSSYAVTDPGLDSFRTTYNKQSLYLNTSPEYAMKRMLARYGVPAYQVCKSFRDDELGPNHNPEFTMLEWYRPGYDQHRLMGEVTGLVGCCLGQRPVRKTSYRELFREYLQSG